MDVELILKVAGEQTKTVNKCFWRSAAARGCKKSVDNGFPPERDRAAARRECAENEGKRVNNPFSRSDVPRCERNEASVSSRRYATQKWTVKQGAIRVECTETSRTTMFQEGRERAGKEYGC